MHRLIISGFLILILFLLSFSVKAIRITNWTNQDISVRLTCTGKSDNLLKVLSNVILSTVGDTMKVGPFQSQYITRDDLKAITVDANKLSGTYFKVINNDKQHILCFNRGRFLVCDESESIFIQAAAILCSSIGPWFIGRNSVG